MLARFILPLIKKTKRINVKSFDFDGSIYNNAYHTSKSPIPNRLFEANEKFIETLCAQIIEEEFTDVKKMVGSLRQNQYINGRRDQCCYKDLNKLCNIFKSLLPDHIQCAVDDYLLADTFGNVAPGDNFQHAVDDDKNYQFSESLADTSKLIILFAQMHKISAENPDAEITFDFYDDLDVMLAELNQFFRENPDLMPANVKLRLHHYNGGKIELINEKPIQGTGKTSFDFQEDVRLMIECSDTKFFSPYREENILEKLRNPSRLQEFKNYRAIKSASYELLQARKQLAAAKKSHLTNFLDAIKKLHADLITDIEMQEARAVSIEKILHSPAFKVMQETLSMLQKLCTYPSDITDIKKYSIDIIKKYEESCKKILNTETFVKTLAKVATAGIGCALGMYAGTPAAFYTGIAASALSGYFLFKPSEIEKDVKNVITNAKQLAESKERSQIEIQTQRFRRTASFPLNSDISFPCKFIL